MWTMFEQLIVQVAITALRLIVKSPKGTAEEIKIVQNIAQAATEADTALTGTVWTSTPGTPTPVT